MFSWPSFDNSYWASIALLYASLIMACFSLVDSLAQQMLQEMPRLDKEEVSEADVSAARRLILWALAPTDESVPSKRARSHLPFRTIMSMFIWQTNLMLSSWSWAFVLVGMFLHVIRVFLPVNPPDGEKRVGPTSIGPEYDSHHADCYSLYSDYRIGCCQVFRILCCGA